MCTVSCVNKALVCSTATAYKNVRLAASIKCEALASNGVKTCKVSYIMKRTVLALQRFINLYG